MFPPLSTQKKAPLLFYSNVPAEIQTGTFVLDQIQSVVNKRYLKEEWGGWYFSKMLI